jgi:hypothetical protein
MLSLVPLCADARAQESGDFVPVGVIYHAAGDAARRRSDLDELRRLGFNVFATPGQGSPAGLEVMSIQRSLEDRRDARVTVGALAVVTVADGMRPEALTREAWSLFAEGNRGIVFGDWAALQRNTGALAAAVEFADHLTRNGALYAPLRPKPQNAEAPAVTVAVGPSGRVSTRFLESDEAMVLVVTNAGGAEPTELTMTFSPEIPEAIWQNMLTGAAVNFLAGPSGPTYTKTLPPDGVLVLMIRKRWK